MGFRVAALSSGPAKEALARELGAHEYVDASAADPGVALAALGGAGVIVDTVQNSAATQRVVPGLAQDGTLLLLALEAAPISISPCEWPVSPSNRWTCNSPLLSVAMVQKRLSVRGWAVGHPKDCEDTLAFAQTHGIKPMVEKFSLEKAREAYDRRGSARFRAVIVPGLE